MWHKLCDITNSVEISGALLTLRIQYSYFESYFEEGARGVNNIWVERLIMTSRKDDEGFLTLKGRVKDRITLINTKKIQSTEIEEMIIKDWDQHDSKLSNESKLGCVVRMVVDSILPNAECGHNGHRKDAPSFNWTIKVENIGGPGDPIKVFTCWWSLCWAYSK